MRDPIFSIALRNVFRHGKRTLITAIVLTAGIGMYIFFDSLLAGMDRMTIDSMVDQTASSVSISTEAYRSESAGFPLEYGIPDPENTASRIAKILPEAEGIAPRTKFVATVSGSGSGDGLPVVAVAVEPKADSGVFTLGDSLREGTWFQGSDEGGVVMGSGLAADLGLAPGDWVLVSARTKTDSMNADEYRLVGILDAAAPEVSASGLFMRYDDARRLLDDDLPVTELDVALPRSKNLDGELAAAAAAAAAVESAFPGLDARPVGKAAADYLAMRNMKSKYSMLIILVVLLIAAVGVVNTVLMSVYSRVREIGVLRAYGMGASAIRRLFALEGLMVGVIGSVGGLALGACAVWYTSAIGLDIGKMMGKVDLGSLPLTGMLRGEWKTESFAFGMIFGLAASWIAALIPARKASKMEVTDALRFV
ncbi:MAG: FtsX-like permease family protein [Rectinema sp.]